MIKRRSEHKTNKQEARAVTSHATESCTDNLDVCTRVDIEDIRAASKHK